MNFRLSKKLYRSALFVLAMAFLAPAHGSTIAQIGTEDLINNSELIFEGTVVSVSTELNELGRIYTYVNFSVQDVLAGSITSGSMLLLRFSGGTVDGVELDLGVRIPAVNERGIYFVEKVSPGLINPLLGWDQGHFIVNDAGEVVAGNSLKVETVELRSRPEITAFSDNVALGVLTNPRAESSSDDSNIQQFEPMLVDDFKAVIRALIK
jgi:hypothetical protein